MVVKMTEREGHLSLFVCLTKEVWTNEKLGYWFLFTAGTDWSRTFTAMPFLL